GLVLHPLRQDAQQAAAGNRELFGVAPAALPALLLDDAKRPVPDEPPEPCSQRLELRVGRSALGGPHAHDLHLHPEGACHSNRQRCTQRERQRGRVHRPNPPLAALTQMIVVPLLGSRRSFRSLPASRSMKAWFGSVRGASGGPMLATRVGTTRTPCSQKTAAAATASAATAAGTARARLLQLRRASTWSAAAATADQTSERSSASSSSRTTRATESCRACRPRTDSSQAVPSAASGGPISPVSSCSGRSSPSLPSRRCWSTQRLKAMR